MKEYKTLEITLVDKKIEKNQVIAITLSVPHEVAVMLDESTITSKHVEEVLESSINYCRDHIQNLINIYRKVR